MARGQAALRTRDTRIPLPAEDALRVLDTALEQLPATRQHLTARALAEWLRARYELVLAFVFFGRQDSCVALRTEDHGIDDDFIWLCLTEKMKKGWAYRRVVRLPLGDLGCEDAASALPRGSSQC